MQYGLLTHTRTRNVGDDIQSIAAWRLLPRIDALADRDFLAEFRPATATKLILNGWLLHRPAEFDLGERVIPLLVSLHINSQASASHDRRAFTDVIRESARIRELLVRHGPVGARDQPTADFLRSLDIPTYLSGCLTLTLERRAGLPRGEEIVVVDAAPAVVERIRALARRPVIDVQHTLGKFDHPPRAFARAEQVLDVYQRAHLVVTSRLHVALPCLAFGTPVVLVRKEFDDPRFMPLGDLVRRFTVEAFLASASSDSLDDPPPNPTTFLPLRRALVERVASFIGPVEAGGVKDVSASASVARIWKGAAAGHWLAHSWRSLRKTPVLRRRRRLIG
jgi:hypothetical protein